MKTLVLTFAAATILGGAAHAQEGSVVPAQAKPGQVEADTLRGPYWRLTAVGDLTPPDRLGAKEPHVTFHPGGSVTGSDGCNTIRGSYTVSGETMKFAGLMGTLMSCSLPDTIDRRFREALIVTRTWKITDGVLTLQDEKGTMLARFEARPD